MYTLLNCNVIIIICSLFDGSDIRHFIVHYTGHGVGTCTGDWWLPDWSRFKLEQILTIWSRRQHRSEAQELLLIMDSCYSGVNVRRLNRYHQQREYENVEIIAASRGETEFDDTGSDLTKAINHDKLCPVGTVCTRSLISKSKSSKLVTVERYRDRNKRYIMKFKWKL